MAWDSSASNFFSYHVNKCCSYCFEVVQIQGTYIERNVSCHNYLNNNFELWTLMGKTANTHEWTRRQICPNKGERAIRELRFAEEWSGFLRVFSHSNGEKADMSKLLFTTPIIVAMGISGMMFISALVTLTVSIYKPRRWNKTSLDGIVSIR